MKFFSYEERDQIYHALGIAVPVGIDNLDEILHPPHKENEIKSLIASLFNQEEINLVYGPEKIGKSFFSNSIAHAITSGSNLNSYHALPETKSVWLVSGEMTDTQEARQTAVSERMFKLNASGNTFLQKTSFPGKLDDENGQRLFGKLLQRINDEHSGKDRISVVILDNIKTLTKAGDQVTGWRSLFNFLNDLRLQKHLTFIVIHHPVKDGTMGGTADLNIKIDTNWQVTRDCTVISPFDAQDNLNPDGKYHEYLAGKIEEWRSENPDDIWFFLVNRAGRSLAPKEKRTVFMHMNPDDSNPQWHVIDFLAKGHPWSYVSFKAISTGVNVLPPPQSREKASEAYNGEVKPNYEQLKESKERDYILRWLRFAYAAGNHDREQMGQFFEIAEGKGKDGIDYLCKKHSITEKDYKDKTQKTNSAFSAENEG